MARATTPIDAALGRLLDRLLDGSGRILGDNFFGLYLCGSLASGGFDPETSDIDFVVVVREDASADAQVKLGALCRELQRTGKPWAEKLEGSFLPLRLFQQPDPPCGLHPTIGMGGRFGLDHKGIERPVQRHMLREDGIALAGPSPKDFIAPVSVAALKRETLEVLNEWWAPQLEDQTRLRRRGYQAYATVTMCRMLYTLATGGVASKPEAARWARQRLDARWHGLIDRAAAWREDDGIDDLAPTLELIRYVVDSTAAR